MPKSGKHTRHWQMDVTEELDRAVTSYVEVRRAREPRYNRAILVREAIAEKLDREGTISV